MKTGNSSHTLIGKAEEQTAYSILIIIGITHLLNDSLQAVVLAMFPILEQSLGLTFTQLGLIAFTINMVASVMQPVIGMYTDKHPMPYALPLGLTSSMIGMFALAFAPNFYMILLSVFFIGIGSATFHPESSRVAYLAAGPRRGFAQSIFQVGGNAGKALAPAITAFVFIPLGQFGAIWFTLVAGIAVLFLIYIARWYKEKLVNMKILNRTSTGSPKSIKTKKIILTSIFILIFLEFSRSWYENAISNYYAFYVMDKYDVTISEAQMYTFLFLFSCAVGTFLGGPFADRFGKKLIILLSQLVPVPLTLILPFVGSGVAFLLLAI